MLCYFFICCLCDFGIREYVTMSVSIYCVGSIGFCRVLLCFADIMGAGGIFFTGFVAYKGECTVKNGGITGERMVLIISSWLSPSEDSACTP